MLQARQTAHRFGGGQIHQAQRRTGQGRRQGVKALQRQGFADRRIHGPAGPQRLHPLAHEALLAQGRIAGAEQHGVFPHLGQAQPALQQGQGRQGRSCRQADGAAAQLVVMVGELLIGACATEAAPAEQPQRLRPVQRQICGPIPPGTSPGEQGHRAVSLRRGCVSQAVQGLAAALERILEHAVGIDQGWGEPAVAGVEDPQAWFHGGVGTRGSRIRQAAQHAVLDAHIGAADGKARAFQHLNPAKQGGWSRRHRPGLHRFRALRRRCGRARPRDGR